MAASLPCLLVAPTPRPGLNPSANSAQPINQKAGEAAQPPMRTAPPPAVADASRLSRPLRLLLPAVVVVPLLVTAAGAWLSWRQAWREAELEVAQQAEASAEYARRVFDGLLMRIERADGLLAGLGDAEITAREAELHAALRRASTAGLPEEGNRSPYVFVFGRDGRPLVSSNVHPVPRSAPWPEREFNQALREPDAPALHVSRVYVGRVTGEPFFALSRRREGTGNGLPPGAYDGVINGSVYVRDAEAALRRLASDRAGDVLSLVRADGAVLARSLPVAPDAHLAANKIGRAHV